MARYTVKKGKYVDTYRAIRVSKETYDAIREAATRENVTLVAMAESMVRFYIQEAEVDE